MLKLVINSIGSSNSSLCEMIGPQLSHEADVQYYSTGNLKSLDIYSPAISPAASPDLCYYSVKCLTSYLHSVPYETSRA